MAKQSNIKLINDFFDNDISNKLIINNVNEEIKTLYLEIIQNISKENSCNILKINNPINIFDDEDLFGNKKIFIIELTNTKKIEEILKYNKKIIILSDYKNYLKFRKKVSAINGYEYISDIKYFLNDYMSINNDDLTQTIIDNPIYFVSELSKYQVNRKNYSKNIFDSKSENFIYKIRIEIIKMKRTGSIIEIFKNIKKEIIYKKFNFLTY